MHNCSNRFTTKLSNPKISNNPILPKDEDDDDKCEETSEEEEEEDDDDVAALMLRTSHKKALPYNSLANASRESQAASGLSGTEKDSPRARTVRSVTALAITSGDTSINSASNCNSS
mmetsp:Transcript_3609/g.5615  ORF Transcript_3609/g.5615 Transcript_3609/m.5615 type:complete len:117 (-) Transcript_3609:1298-1648(-)